MSHNSVQNIVEVRPQRPRFVDWLQYLSAPAVVVLLGWLLAKIDVVNERSQSTDAKVDVVIERQKDISDIKADQRALWNAFMEFQREQAGRNANPR